MDTAHVTTWENTSDHKVVVKIFKGPGPTRHHRKHDIYTVEPKGTVQIPGECDQAIQTVRGGMVVGGLAPQLVKKGTAPVPVHTSLLDAAEQGDLERATAGRRAGAPISLDVVEDLKRRMAKVEDDAHARLVQAADDIDRAKDEAAAAASRAAAAEAELAQLKAMMEQQAAASTAKATAKAPAKAQSSAGTPPASES